MRNLFKSIWFLPLFYACTTPQPVNAPFGLTMGARSHMEIQSAVENRKEFFKACYEKEAKKNKNFSAQINSLFSITPVGKVENVRLDSSVKNKTFVSCIRDIMYTFHFSKLAGKSIVDVKYPFRFSFSNPHGLLNTISNGPLSYSQIEKGVTKRLKRIKNCYRLEIKKDPRFEGKIVAYFLVNFRGKVTQVNLGTFIKKRSFLTCVKKEIYKMQFPTFKKGETMKVKYPFTFSNESTN